YLDADSNRASGAIDLVLEVLIETAQMRANGEALVRLSLSNFTDSYWTVAQMLAHHTINGCNLTAGDLFGSGTMSGSAEGSQAALIELTSGGVNPVRLPNGETRSFLEDGDRVILRGWCERDGACRIGFGEATGTVLPQSQGEL
ncbi:MAG: fumarylacetoacetate hydrolase family protein, partial [Pseudomonadales bacterium]